MEEHFVGKVAQKAIIERDGKVLIARDIRDADMWELPGGRLNMGETPIEGLQREIQEELGVEVFVRGVVHTERFTHTQRNEPTLLLAYHAALVDPAAEFVCQPDEIAEVRWVDASELYNQNIYPIYREALEVFFNMGA